MLVYVDKEGRLLLNSTVEEILPPRISRLRASSEAPQVWSPALAELVLGPLPQNQSDQSEDGILYKDTIRAEGGKEEE